MIQSIIDMRLNNMDTFDHTQLLIHYAEEGNADEVRRLIPLSDPEQLGHALLKACFHEHIECMRCLLEHAHTKDDLLTCLTQSARRGSIDCVKLLIKHIEPDTFSSVALRIAVNYHHIDLAKFLIPLSDSQACDNEALVSAATNGLTSLVKILIPLSDPKAQHSQALIEAVLGEHGECVKLLIGVSDCSPALVVAAECNFLHMVQLLLPHSDARYNKSDALQWAAINDNPQMFDTLYPHSNPQDALEQLRSDPLGYEKMQHYVAVAKARDEKQVISDRLDGLGKYGARRKI